MPWTFGDGQLLQHTVWLVSAGLRTSAGDTGLDECGHIIAHLWPEIVPADEFESLRLAWMARKRVVMTSLEDAGPQVSVVRYVHSTIVKEEAGVRTRPLVLGVRLVFRSVFVPWRPPKVHLICWNVGLPDPAMC